MITIQRIQPKHTVILTGNTTVESIGEGAHIIVQNGSLTVLGSVAANVTIEFASSTGFFNKQNLPVNLVVQQNVLDNVTINWPGEVTVLGQVGDQVTIVSRAKNIRITGKVGDHTQLQAQQGRIEIGQAVGEYAKLMSHGNITCLNVKAHSVLKSNAGHIACAKVEEESIVTAAHSIQATDVKAKAQVTARHIKINSQDPSAVIVPNAGTLYINDYLAIDNTPRSPKA